MTQPILDVRSLKKAYGAHTVLHDVSFSLHPGELVAFLGRNGAGKSTTMRIVAGLQVPDAGDVLRSQGESGALRVGLTPQELDLPPHLSVDECLDLAASLEGWDDEAVQRAMDTGLEHSGLRGMRGRLVRELSGGMKRRLGIALALLPQPELLLLDESFTGLDPESVLHVEGLLRAHQAKGGAILLSSHVLDHVQRIADRVLILHGGRIVENLDRESLADLIPTEFPSLHALYLEKTRSLESD